MAWSYQSSPRRDYGEKRKDQQTESGYVHCGDAAGKNRYPDVFGTEVEDREYRRRSWLEDISRFREPRCGNCSLTMCRRRCSTSCCRVLVGCSGQRCRMLLVKFLRRYCEELSYFVCLKAICCWLGLYTRDSLLCSG